jgi:mannose-6-phosphate isomerase-like protein (cupin superfamily)
MKVFKLDDMVKGWFIGNFDPHAYKTDSFEVNYRTHPKGEKWDYHYHTKSKEINLVINGRMLFNDIELTSGDIFIVEPWQVSDPEFLEDTSVVCVRVPSTNDKTVFELKE